MKHLFAITLLSTIISPAYAEAPFTYLGKPIHPTCVAKLVELGDKKNEDVSLSACSKSSMKVNLRDGYYTTRDENNQHQQESTGYATFGNKGDHFLIATDSWTGGSGIFTAIIWVQLKNNTLHLAKILAGGDRCNGGTNRVADWKYSINDTPYDMLSRASGEPLKLKYYDEIEASASSCAAQSIFRFDPVNDKTEFVNMLLNNEPLPIDDYSKKIKYQVCFSQLYNSWLARGKITLTQHDIDLFKNQFVNFCMSSPGK